MDTDKRMSDKIFDWGDSVRILDAAPQKYYAMGTGSVCAIRVIETKDVSEEFDEPIGSILYLVEGSDGLSLEIPERFLEAI